MVYVGATQVVVLLARSLLESTTPDFTVTKNGLFFICLNQLVVLVVLLGIIDELRALCRVGLLAMRYRIGCFFLRNSEWCFFAPQ